MRAHKQGSYNHRGYYDDFYEERVGATIEVYEEDEHEWTGLYDQNGAKLFRVPEIWPMGYKVEK